MKIVIMSLAIFVFGTINAQISTGSNFISISNTVFNKPITKFDQYPDTTLNDSTTATGANASIMLNYHFAVSNHFSIGFKSRFLSNKESTYGISAFGPAVRYYFGFGPDEPKPKIKKVKPGEPKTFGVYPARRFYLNETDERLKSFFFVEGSYLFGNLKYDSERIKYNEAGLQVGVQLRAATPDIQFIRHFGLELGVGIFGHSDELENNLILPNVSGGLLIFLDKKYTSSRRIMRVVEFEEK